ncbi:response regulator receiver domain-containing protein [Sinobacterium caligoides]|uniref:Response regulator receiver domain-containing protein n=1 Tax=Sinobacterium caligoides TaxID=933926 RepID=A0A3N2DXY6_9GAMM|nr:fused response regulator/phosphatase [Sinobacterium caligoides]ROS04678.1 response regulator receiver domain-containing protein [Sinobacterium caligoides]
MLWASAVSDWRDRMSCPDFMSDSQDKIDNKDFSLLIAEDNAADRLLLVTILKRLGYRVVEAKNGQEAIELFQRNQPNIVLLDVLMPVVDGFETARQIRLVAGDDFIPIIFLSSLQEAKILEQYVQAGGDDFITKPYNRVMLAAKITSFRRMQSMHLELQRQRDEISRNNQHLLQEQEVAKAVYDKVTRAGCLGVSNIRYIMSPLSIFNGDVLLAAIRPRGTLLVLLGDFTGHGLAAALGAMPLSQSFYAMAEKGYSAPDILRELNDVLGDALPVGYFCCACLVELNLAEQTLWGWNGGLPDCYIFHRQDAGITPLRSTGLPLGILRTNKFKSEGQYYDISYGDKVYLWSDGIIEASNARGEMFGEGRLRAVFDGHSGDEALMGEVMRCVSEFVGGGAQSDDLSFVEVEMIESTQFGQQNVPQLARAKQGRVDWSLEYRLGFESLKNSNPLPLLHQLLLEVPALRTYSGDIYTILAELYSNALEHGVLRLSSVKKATGEGFIEYYQQRERRLKDLTSGHISIAMRYQGDDNSGELSVRMTDSGHEYIDSQDIIEASNPYSGRGLGILKQLCYRVSYTKGDVEIGYRWQE